MYRDFINGFATNMVYVTTEVLATIRSMYIPLNACNTRGIISSLLLIKYERMLEECSRALRTLNGIYPKLFGPMNVILIFN